MPIPEELPAAPAEPPEIDFRTEEPPKEKSGDAESPPPPSFFRETPGGAGNAEKRKTAPEVPGGRRRRIIMGSIFYLALLIIVIQTIVFCVKRFSPGGNPAAGTAEAPHGEEIFAFRYERVILSRNNIFRFSLAVEGNSAEMTLDDIRHHRSLHRPIQEPAGVHAFRNAVRASGITRMTPPVPPRERQSVRRRITIVADNRITEFEIDGETVPPEVARIEDAVDNFAGTYGLKTISLTPEQLRELAAESFAKAEDLFDNREANYGNLREAIRRYAQTVSYLEQFSPRPPLWARASKRLSEAQELRKQRFQELNFELIRQEKLGNKAQVRQVLKQIMDLVDLESRQYGQARTKLFQLDNSGRKNR